MPLVVKVKFIKNNIATGKVYYFDNNELELKDGDRVIVEAAEHDCYCEVVGNLENISEDKITSKLKVVKYLAGEKEEKQHLKNVQDCQKIVKEVRELVEKYALNMQIISAEYTFNRKQLLVQFISDQRIDFRELVKDMAAKYRTHIVLRQVGVRDEAKVIGGIGMCGRILCCNSYLTEFSSVSINMAKNQNLSLIPSKISGVCGRLLCCLVYEDETYKELKKGLPKMNSVFETENGKGKVVGINVLTKTMRVLVKDHGIVEVKLDGSD